MTDYIIDGSVLTDISDATRNITGDTELIVPEDIPEKVADCYNKGLAAGQAVEDAFVTNSLSAYRNDRVTKIGIGSFYHSLAKTLEFPNVTDIEQWAFFRAKSEKILCPKAERMGYEAFYYADRMLEIDLPLLVEVPSDGFLYCSMLQKAKLDSCKTIGNLGLAYCPALVDVYAPLVTTLGTSAFYGTSFATLDLPSCTSIGANVFSANTKLATLILRAPTMCNLANANALSGTRIAAGAGYVYVPDELVGSYKADAIWSTYANRIKPISELEGDA